MTSNTQWNAACGKLQHFTGSKDSYYLKQPKRSSSVRPKRSNGSSGSMLHPEWSWAFQKRRWKLHFKRHKHNFHIQLNNIVYSKIFGDVIITRATREQIPQQSCNSRTSSGQPKTKSLNWRRSNNNKNEAVNLKLYCCHLASNIFCAFGSSNINSRNSKNKVFFFCSVLLTQQ